MIESRSKVIGEHRYTVSQLGAKRGRQAFAKLARYVAPALVALTNTEGETAAFFAMLSNLAQSLPPEELDFFCDLFSERTQVELGGKPVELQGIFDVHFAGKYFDMFEWLSFCLEVNYGSFLEGMKGLKNSAAGTRSQPNPA